MILEISYSHKNGIYTTGDVVSGNIRIKTDQPIEAKGLSVYMVMKIKMNTETRQLVELDSTNNHGSMKIHNLDEALFDGSKNQTKILPIGIHLIPFQLDPIPKDYPHSTEADTTYRRYFVRAVLKMKLNKSKSVEKKFMVCSLPLDDNLEALEWQTKTETKYLMLSRKKVSAEVAVPTGIDHRELVPILLRISNDTDNPKVIIRSKLISILKFKNPSLIRYIAGAVPIFENVEEVIADNSVMTHFLQVNTDKTYTCPLVSRKYFIRIEVESSNKLIRMEFPVVVGAWKDQPERGMCPLGTAPVTLLERHQQTPSAPPISLATTGPAPPTYLEAMQAPPLPSKAVDFYKVRALASFKGALNSELSFESGQIIENVHESNENGWLMGTLNGKTGLIPARYVEQIKEEILRF